MKRIVTKDISLFNRLKKMAVHDDKSPIMKIVYRTGSRRLVMSGRISNHDTLSSLITDKRFYKQYEGY